MTPPLTPEQLEGLLERATGTGRFAISGLDRPLPWEVWTSNSFRRVKTVRGIDVLSGYTLKDGCVDLSMPEDRLVALIELVNQIPSLLVRIRDMEAENSAAIRNVYRLQTDNAALADALSKCRDQFQFYANEHLASDKPVKAATNQRFADLARSALNRSTDNA